MAITSSKAHKYFKVLVKCQLANGVRLVHGKNSSNAAREFVHFIAKATTEKCAGIISGSDFMSILSDGSQARKTNDEKELVLVRVERSGVPIYFAVSLLEILQEVILIQSKPLLIAFSNNGVRRMESEWSNTIARLQRKGCQCKCRWRQC